MTRGLFLAVNGAGLKLSAPVKGTASCCAGGIFLRCSLDGSVTTWGCGTGRMLCCGLSASRPAAGSPLLALGSVASPPPKGCKPPRLGCTACSLLHGAGQQERASALCFLHRLGAKQVGKGKERCNFVVLCRGNTQSSPEWSGHGHTKLSTTCGVCHQPSSWDEIPLIPAPE